MSAPYPLVPKSNPFETAANREFARVAAAGAAAYVARETGKVAARQVAKVAAKGAVNPALVLFDFAELGVEKATGSKVAAKSTSFAGYVGTGALVSGPVGAGVGAALWGVGQLVDLALS